MQIFNISTALDHKNGARDQKIFELQLKLISKSFFFCFSGLLFCPFGCRWSYSIFEWAVAKICQGCFKYKSCDGTVWTCIIHGKLSKVCKKTHNIFCSKSNTDIWWKFFVMKIVLVHTIIMHNQCIIRKGYINYFFTKFSRMLRLLIWA